MPTFDELNIELSKRVGDTVAAAGTNGSRFTSAMRVFALNEAIRRFIVKAARTNLEDALREYITEEGQALTNNLKVLSGWTGGAAWVFSAYNSTDSLPVQRAPNWLVPYLKTGGNQYLTASTTNQYWTIDAGNFRLIDGGTTTGDTIQLRYVKQHTDLSAGGTILIPAQYHPMILDLGVSVLKENEGTSEAFAQAQVKEEKVGRALGG